ncbi:MAG: DNA recombination protein RmuC [Clostridiales bacterium]|nr:DNA recombination protein RmuC [Clostridiales bacterium]
MCFFYKKRLFKQQEKLMQKLLELERENRENREIITSAYKVGNAALVSGISATNEAVLSNVKDITSSTEIRINQIKEDINKNLVDIRQNTEKALKDVRDDNERQLKEIRTVVDEKLTKSLDERIAKSFLAISERLDAVNKGLGEMQVLSSGVADLKNVLANVKTRGVLGEVSLINILENILTNEQYHKQFRLKKNSNECVDFAIVLPGKNKKERVYLPIDAKFPIEDYQRIIASSESGDINALSQATKKLEQVIKTQAKSIKDKYILPPITVDFAIMYLPIEGLYAEVVKNPGLLEELQNKYKVVPAGPTTITALLNSLQIGFRTLAIQKSSKEVFDLLAKFRVDFNKFVDNIERAQTQVQSAGKSLSEATKRTGIILKKLDKVEGINILEDEIKGIAE